MNDRRIDVSFAEIGSNVVSRVTASDDDCLLAFPSLSSATRVTRRVRDDSFEIVHREIRVTRFTREARGQDQVIDLESTIFPNLAVDFNGPGFRLSVVFGVSFDRRLEPDVQFHYLRVMLHPIRQSEEEEERGRRGEVRGRRRSDEKGGKGEEREDRWEKWQSVRFLSQHSRFGLPEEKDLELTCLLECLFGTNKRLSI